MKKALALLMSLLITVSFCSCLTSSILANSKNSVQTLELVMFQYESRTDEYCLYFTLFNKNDEPVSANVEVDIRIVNDNGTEVYKGTKSVKKDDFKYYSTLISDKQYLGRVGIASSLIRAGKTSSGTVYVTVYNSSFRFNELNISTSRLPIEEIKIVSELPAEVTIKDVSGKVKSVIRIEDVSSAEANTLLGTNTKITLSGTKTFGDTTAAYDIVEYKVYDSGGYMISYGKVYLSNLGKDDKFRDDSITVKDLTPGETYTIRFFES